MSEKKKQDRYPVVMPDTVELEHMLWLIGDLNAFIRGDEDVEDMDWLMEEPVLMEG